MKYTELKTYGEVRKALMDGLKVERRPVYMWNVTLTDNNSEMRDDDSVMFPYRSSTAPVRELYKIY